MAVYPRVGGEPQCARPNYPASTGLSPRGRGTLQQDTDPHDMIGSIPAWAGNPLDTGVSSPPKGVYPRVGGEPNCQPLLTPKLEGLSPRGRGTRPHHLGRGEGHRSIPAWAGNPWAPCPGLASAGVYPRVGGEPPAWPCGPQRGWGLSPRGRGTRMVLGTVPCMFGVYPRVGGEPGPEGWNCNLSSGLSPRGRGTLAGAVWKQPRQRSIPAWAGNPLAYQKAHGKAPVYPRVGGEPPTA